MLALNRKVLRDVRNLSGQLLAIGMVIAAGAGLFLAMRTCLASLEGAKDRYYAQERFAHVFCSLRRAPEHVADRLREIPGVVGLQTRVVAQVSLDLDGVSEAVTGRLVSLPDSGRSAVNAVRLRSGRMPLAGSAVEVLVSEAFAEAHELALGARLGALIDGSHQELRMVGTAASPEFIYTLAPGTIFPDDKLFGVLWMRRAALGPAFDLEGAFNDLGLRLAADANPQDVIRRVDLQFARYGGLGAYPRRDQQSHFFLNSELEQLSTIGLAVPVTFLLVAAFLLNIVIGRIIAGQRPQVAALKALGYSDREVGGHYAKLVSVVVGVGLVLGGILAGWLGAAMIDQYSAYYRLPDLTFAMSLRDVVIVVAICLVSATLGTWTAIRRTVRLPPAEAMRSEAPAVYRRTLLERFGLTRFVPAAFAMILREMERKPIRRLFTLGGMIMATSLVVGATFMIDAIDSAMNVTFELQRREDVQVSLARPRSVVALTELEHLPGVLHAEPFRGVPVRLRSQTTQRSASITGMPANATLSQVLDLSLQRIELPTEGLVLTEKLAEVLGVEVGDTLRVEVLEGQRVQTEVEVARVAEAFVGLGAYMDIDALCRMLREPRTLNGAWLTVDDSLLHELHAAVKVTPSIAGLSSRNDALRGYKKLIDDNLGVMIGINMIFSLIMALGILYNAARITLAEQAHQLASLRVLGFRRREVAAILLGELGLLTAVAIPLGLLAGYGFAAAMVEQFDTEQLRIPLQIAPRTYGLAAVTVLAAALFSGWAVWRKLDRMDIIEVLKVRE